MKFENLLADRTSVMGASAIREILKVVSQPGMVSLAGGIPSPESFPMKIIKELTDKVLTKYGSCSLQYDLTEGFLPLREALVSVFEKRGIKAAPENINITSGSQGVLDAVAKILITKGDKIKWVWEQGIGVKDKENNLIFIEGYINDITDRKLALQSLEKPCCAVHSAHWPNLRAGFPLPRCNARYILRINLLFLPVHSCYFPFSCLIQSYPFSSSSSASSLPADFTIFPWYSTCT